VGTSDKSLKGSIHFSWMEFSGSLGDLGLFLPLVVAMTIACDLDIGVILILAGLMNVITGLLFCQPIPVQPMKAIAAIVITEGLVYDELVAAGILMGLVFLLFAGFVDQINRFIPKPVVRGIQLGIGLKLAIKGAGWVSGLALIGWDSIFLAIVVFITLLTLANRKLPMLLYIFLLGFVFLYLKQPNVFSAWSVSWPNFYWHWPSQSAWSGGFLRGALPQLPLSLLNSVVALCALSSEYFPGRGVQPRKISASVGLMNLICVPLGGIPMCHGAGGLAAQYRFGARTGGSVILLGALKIIAGFIFGGALFGLLQSYPMAVLGPMLIFAGIELARSSRDITGDKKALMIALVTAVFIISVNTLAGFCAGAGVSAAYAIQPWRKK
jgi:MFS superfamily sulfate permease-like transporter